MDSRHLDEPWAEWDLDTANVGVIEQCALCCEWGPFVDMFEHNGKTYDGECYDKVLAADQIGESIDAARRAS